MALPIPPSKNNPIPNDPFYSVQEPYIEGAYFPVIAGSGVEITLTGDVATIDVTGGGGGGTVTSIVAGTGLDGGTITTSGTISLSDTAVTPGSYTYASLTIDQQGRITAASDGTPPAGGTVTSITAGTGLTGGTITTSGTIDLADTAVTPGSYTYGSFTVDSQGRLTAASDGTAPNTTVSAPITNTGTAVAPVIGLADTTVTPGSYTYASLTVDAQGRLTAASDGTAPVASVSVTSPITDTGTATVPNIGVDTATTGQLGVVQVGTNIDVAAGVISVKSSSTSQAGLVQLNDTVTSTSTTEALTANQGYLLQQQIDALALSSNLTLAGTLDSSTGNLATVTTEGTAAGFSVGSALPSASVSNDEYFVIVTVPSSSYTPPGGTATQTHVGDWFLSNGTAWEFLNVGNDPDYATTTTPGVVQLATTADVQAGTDATLAVTPTGAAATYIPFTAYATKGTILSASAAATTVALPVGTNGQVLAACSTTSSGLVWANACQGTVTSVATGTGLTGGPITSAGTIDLADTAVTPGTYFYSTVTVDQQGRLTAASTGVTPVLPSSFTAKGDVLAGTGIGTYSALNVGTAGQVLSVDATTSSGLKWITLPPPGVASVAGSSPITVNNTDPANPIVSIDAASTTQSGAVRLNDTVTSTLTTQAATANAVKTAYDLAAAAVPCSSFTAVGDLLAGSGSGTYTALTVGTNGKVLAANSGCSAGMEWVAACQGTVTSVATGTGLTGGPVTTTGTIALADTAVTPGSYAYSSITVDQQGRLTAASDGSTPVLPSDFTVKGDILAATGAGTYSAFPAGTNGQTLIANSACSNGLEWVSVAPGNVASVTGTSPVTVNNTDPQNPVVGIDAASTTQAGAVQLYDNVDSTSTTQAATANAVKTAYDLANAAIPKSSFTASGELLVGSGAGTYAPLTPGPANSFLSSDGAGALTWITQSPGDVTTVTGTAPIVVDNTDPQNPVVSVTGGSTTSPGVVQLNDTVTSTSTSQAATANAAKTAYDKGVDACTVAQAAVPCSAYTAVGTILAGNGSGTYCSLLVGTNDQVLVPNSACAAGVEWVTRSALALCGYTCTATPFNTAIGANAGDSITTGTGNTLVGYNVGTTLATGVNNTAIGTQAGASTVGSNNVLVGFCSGNALGVAGSNTFVGGISGFRATAADSSVGVGYCTLAGVMTGDFNTALGTRAGETVSSGTRNTFVGPLAGRSVTTGSCNVIIGGFAGSASLTNNIVLSTGGGTPAIRFQSNQNGAWSPDGTNYGTIGQVLASNGTVAAPSWCTLSLACVPCAAFTAAGDLLVGTGSGTYTALPVGSNDSILVADSACTGGVKWIAPAPGAVDSVTGTAPITVDNTDPNNPIVGVNVATAVATGAVSVGANIGVNGAGEISVASASTTVSGVVQLNDTVTSTSTTEAGTANAVKTAYDLANAAIPKTALTAKGAILGASAAGTPSALGVGTDGQILFACSAAATGLCWASAPTAQCATPTIFGLVKGTTNNANGNMAFGCDALNLTLTGTNNTAIGQRAMCSITSGVQNTALGLFSSGRLTTGGENVTIGFAAGNCLTTGFQNVLLGSSSNANFSLTGCGNLTVGYSTGNITSGCYNVAIGCGARVADGTASCQLAIGFSPNDNWITGNSTKAIKPGAGIIDCANSCGTAGQVLFSTGSNSICWGPFAVPQLQPFTLGSTKGYLDGSGNVGIGCGAGALLGSGTTSNNSAMGTFTLTSLSNGTGNVAIGSGSIQNMTTGSFNTAVGNAASQCTLDCCNTSLGYRASYNRQSGSSNVTIGYLADCVATSGSQNVAIGPNVQVDSATGSCQLALGFANGQNWLTGNSTKAIKPGAGIIDILDTCGTANQVLVSTGANSVRWRTIDSLLVAPNYGSFYDTTTQTNTVNTGTGRAIELNTLDIANNFALDPGSRITAAVAGTYNLQFSVQFETSQSSAQTMEIWLVKNNVAVDNTNTQFVSKGSGEAYFAALNYLVQLNAGEYVQLFWASGDSNMTLVSKSSSYGGPAIPSVILTIVPVGV